MRASSRAADSRSSNPGTSATRNSAVGLRSDGTLEHWGLGLGANEPPLPAGVYYVELATGYGHILARRSDGTVAAWEYYQGYHGLEPPPLGPGESYTAIAAGDNLCVAAVGPTSTYVSFAGGCSGSMPVARLVPRDTPRIGYRLRVLLNDLPASQCLHKCQPSTHVVIRVSAKQRWPVY